MIKALKKLFGGSEVAQKAIETAAEGLYNGLDMLIYTDEEREKALEKARETFLEFAKIAYEQNSVRAVTRRWLAFLVLFPNMGIIIAAAVIWYWDKEYANFLFMLASKLLPLSVGILVFYFGPHLMGSFPGKGKK